MMGLMGLVLPVLGTTLLGYSSSDQAGVRAPFAPTKIVLSPPSTELRGCLNPSHPLRLGDLVLIESIDHPENSQVLEQLLQLEVVHHSQGTDGEKTAEIDVLALVVPALKRSYPSWKVEVTESQTWSVPRCSSEVKWVPSVTSPVYLANLVQNYIRKKCVGCILRIVQPERWLKLSSGLSERPTGLQMVGDSALALLGKDKKIMGYIEQSMFRLKLAALVAQVDLKMNDMLSDDRFQVRDIEITLKECSELVLPGMDISSFVVDKPLRAGFPLKLNHIKKRSLIKSFDKVTGILRKNGVELLLPVVALKSGAEGDRISVKVDTTKKIMNARVIDQNLVDLGD